MHDVPLERRASDVRPPVTGPAYLGRYVRTGTAAKGNPAGLLGGPVDDERLFAPCFTIGHATPRHATPLGGQTIAAVGGARLETAGG